MHENRFDSDVIRLTENISEEKNTRLCGRDFPSHEKRSQKTYG